MTFQSKSLTSCVAFNQFYTFISLTIYILYKFISHTLHTCNKDLRKMTDMGCFKLLTKCPTTARVHFYYFVSTNCRYTLKIHYIAYQVHSTQDDYLLDTPFSKQIIDRYYPRLWFHFDQRGSNAYLLGTFVIVKNAFLYCHIIFNFTHVFLTIIPRGMLIL